MKLVSEEVGFMVKLFGHQIHGVFL